MEGEGKERAVGGIAQGSVIPLGASIRVSELTISQEMMSRRGSKQAGNKPR